MLKKLVCLLACLVLVLPCAALGEGEDSDTLTDEEWAAMAAEDAEDDDLTPLSEEELLNILAAAEDSSFLVLPEDFDIDDENVFTLLLIGSDSYFPDKRGRADTVILVQLNAKKKTIKLASFLRDLYVNIPGKGRNRLNASYIWGGEKLLRKTLEVNFGVKADAYAEVNFTRMIDVIDRIGGIEVEVSEKEMKQVNSILRFYNAKTGDPEEDQLLNEYGPSVHLTGKQAMSFARIRKIDGDVKRTARQRKVLEAAFRKVTSLEFTDMVNLVSSNLDAVNTDITLQQLMNLFPKALVCHNASFETMSVPAGGTYHQGKRNGMAVLVADLEQNQELIWEFFSVE